jgi:hypothetical protein
MPLGAVNRVNNKTSGSINEKANQKGVAGFGTKRRSKDAIRIGFTDQRPTPEGGLVLLKGFSVWSEQCGRSCGGFAQRQLDRPTGAHCLVKNVTEGGSLPQKDCYPW